MDNDNPADEIPCYAPTAIGQQRVGIPRQRLAGEESMAASSATRTVQSCELRDDSKAGAGRDVMMLDGRRAAVLPALRGRARGALRRGVVQDGRGEAGMDGLFGAGVRREPGPLPLKDSGIPTCPRCKRIDRVEEEEQAGSSQQWFVCGYCGTRFTLPRRR